MIHVTAGLVLCMYVMEFVGQLHDVHRGLVAAISHFLLCVQTSASVCRR
jgi:hypothetical protein